MATNAISWAIPFNRAGLAGPELDYIGEAIRRGHISGNGEFTARCERILEEETGSPRVLLTTSCTHALEMAALLLDVGPGDEVIVPSFTFVSTVNAFMLRGAQPRFVDIRPDTLNLDERLLEDALGPRSKVVVPVHYGGVGCARDAILKVAAERGLAVLEDNAHGIFGSWRGKPLGGFGDLGALSFHETKNISCGEGGALMINRPDLIERAEIIREKGTNRSQLFRGQTDKYTWLDLGSSYVLSDLLAGFLLAQLEARQRIQERRRAIWNRYRDGLRDWAAAAGVSLPVVPDHCRSSYHLFHLLLPSADARDGLIEHLRARRICSVFHYLPLHLSPMGRRYGGREGDCPVTEDVSARLIRLPFFTGLEETEQDLVIAAVREFEP